MTEHMKLGRKAVHHDPKTLQLANYLDTSLPPAPRTKSWAGKVPSWGMMRNDTLGDCTCAAVGHQVQLWTSNAGTLVTISDNEIVAAYSAITGYTPSDPNTDQGAVELDVLNYWRKTGIGGHKIGAFVAVEPGNEEHIRDSIALFGSCYLGISLPITAQTQAVWSVPAGGPHGRGAPGSWGGHAVVAVGYDTRGVTVVTWGQLKTMTWKFFTTYVEEGYALISSDWIKNTGIAPSGFNITALAADLKLVSRH